MIKEMLCITILWMNDAYLYCVTYYDVDAYFSSKTFFNVGVTTEPNTLSSQWLLSDVTAVETM